MFLLNLKWAKDYLNFARFTYDTITALHMKVFTSVDEYLRIEIEFQESVKVKYEAFKAASLTQFSPCDKIA